MPLKTSKKSNKKHSEVSVIGKMLPELITNAYDSEKDYNIFYKKMNVLIDYIFYKKFSSQSLFKEDMQTEAQVALYREFFVRKRPLSTINRLFNFVCHVIYKAFIGAIRQELKEASYRAPEEQLEHSRENFVYIDEDYDEYQEDSFTYKCELSYDDKLLIFNTLLPKIRFRKKDEHDICTYYAAIQIFSRERFNFALPKRCLDVGNISLYKDYIKYLYQTVVEDLKKERLV